MNRFRLSRRALVDLREIWEFVYAESFDAADRLLEEFYGVFGQIAAMPGLGRKRPDITPRDLRFWRLHSYLILYQESKPLRVVRIIHAKRDVKRLLNP